MQARGGELKKTVKSDKHTFLHLELQHDLLCPVNLALCF